MRNAIVPRHRNRSGLTLSKGLHWLDAIATAAATTTAVIEVVKAIHKLFM